MSQFKGGIIAAMAVLVSISGCLDESSGAGPSSAFAGGDAALAPQVYVPPGPVPPNTIIVKYRPTATPAQRSAALVSVGGGTWLDYGQLQAPAGPVSDFFRCLAAVTVTGGGSLRDACIRLKTRHPTVVEYAEEDGYYFFDSIPNDARYPEQWALPKIGMPAAWDRSIGSSSIKVALIDSGMDWMNNEIYWNCGNAAEWGGVNGVDDD